MTLNELKIGQSGVITAVGGDGPLRCRLLDMGLIPRTAVKLMKVAPMGDPIEIRVRGYELTLPGLPEKELTFTLSESENPKPPKLSIPFKLVFLLAGFACFVLIGGGVIAVVLIVKRKNNRGKEQS